MMRSSSRRHSTKSSASSVRSRGSTRSSASARPASDTQTRERVNSQPSRPSPLALHRGISLELDDAPAPDVRDTGSVVTSRTSSIASRKQLQTAEHLTAGPVRDSPDAGFGFDAEDDDDTDANDRNRTQTVTGTHPSSEGLTKYMSEIHLNNDSGPGRKKKTKKNKKNLWIDQSLSGLLEAYRK
ncbi:hypothetical protein PTSG_00141 [Salpingoeca rosetta]|uniref:Uncharacterized protein n=1 Tax=Salpingoeca rosetta (strain ATCC 50818 / BSB-021) TaxID=946362 RepID=F2TVM7_SALR5|nr:uncharacterized protein PTSG_00141 [Salpingoeca rosetta]EGD72123.1 hypothetical protein PTSG_00141 [Salpingoeca rosetta]|eukprot:XP_004998695.1 hypothetical protein PTSG_00141 [Salpingoeca rosetta]